MFHKNLCETPGESIRLADLLVEMKWASPRNVEASP